MTDANMLSENLCRESEARKAAEKRLEEVAAELYQTSAALQYRTQIVAEKSAKLRQVNEDMEQLRLRLAHSEKMAKLGLLLAGIGEEIIHPLAFIAENLKSVNSYYHDIFGLIEQQAEAVELSQSTGVSQAAQVKNIKKLKKKINFDFIKSDIGSLLKDSDEAVVRVQTLVGDVTQFCAADRREIAEEDINRLLDRSLNIASSELRYKAEIIKQYSRLPNIFCDGSQLVQAFLNLLFNAVESIDPLVICMGTYPSH